MPRRPKVDDARLWLKEGTTVLVQTNVDAPRWYFGGQLFCVARRCDDGRYACFREEVDSEERHLFARDQLVPLVGEEVKRHLHHEKKLRSETYDPNGPHPPPPKDKAAQARALAPLLRRLCPNVEQFARTDTCLHCSAKAAGEERMSCCARCRWATFCSRECMKAGWKRHKRDCTTREERVVQVRAQLRQAFEQRPTPTLEGLECALDIAGERVGGAQLLITACTALMQSGCIDERSVVLGIRELCGMRVSSEDMMRLAHALGVADDLLESRHAEIAEFQRIEIALEEPRKRAIELWKTTVRGLVVQADSQCGLGGRLHKARATTPRQLGDAIAEFTAKARGDKGSAVTDLLLFMDECRRDVTLDKKKEKNFPADVKKASTQLDEAWGEWFEAVEGKRLAAERPMSDHVQTSRCFRLMAMVNLRFEDEHIRSGGTGTLRLTQRDISDYLDQPRRWLPHDYTPGRHTGNYSSIPKPREI